MNLAVTPRRDTRGTLRRTPEKKACCASCAAGGPCAGGCAGGKLAGGCCGSCAAGGGCEGADHHHDLALPPAVYGGHVPPHRGGKLWLFRVQGQNRSILLPRTSYLPGEEAVVTVVADDVRGALVRLRGRAGGLLDRRPRVSRDTRGVLGSPEYRLSFWGPSEAEWQAFETLRGRWNRVLNFKDAQGRPTEVFLTQPTIQQMIAAWRSFVKLWLSGDEDPDQLTHHAKDLAIVENSARDHGYDKPSDDVVVPLPQDNPFLEDLAEAGEALEDAGVPMPDPHSDKGLDLEGALRVVKTTVTIMAVAAGLYVAAPVVARVVQRRAA